MIDLNLFGAPAFLIDVVPGGFRFNRVNPAREIAARRAARDIEGRSPHQLFGPAVADRMVRQFEDCVRRGRAVYYEEVLAGPGESSTFLTTLSPIMTQDGTRVIALLGVAVDITERKRAEERIRQQAERAEREAAEAHARLRDAIDFLPEAIVFLDAEDRYVLWNRKYAELYPDVADLLAPGVAYADILQASIDRGAMPEVVDDKEAWRRERLVALRRPGAPREELYSGGRWIRYDTQATSDGGTIGVRVDITDLKAREQSFRLLFKENPIPMWLYDPQSLAFLDVNDQAVAAYGYPREQFLRMSILDIRPPDEREPLAAAVREGTDLGKSTRIWRHRHADGTIVDVETYACELDHQGRPAVLVGVVDVTERRRTEARIAHLAHHDPLTELPNRALFLERLAEEFTRHRFQDQPAVVLFLDLDHFKEVNDGLGHAEGDVLLRQVARRLRNCLRSEDVVARLGGDEFAILIGQLDHPDHVRDLALRIVEVVSRPYRLSDQEVVIGVSLGIAFLPGDAESAAEVLRRADTALYRAKEAGRRTYRIYEPAMDAKLQARRALVHDIGHALSFGQFHLEFQPLVDLASNRISTCEALLRWRHPVRGLVSPADFIPIAEDIGLIVQLGEWVLQQACLEAMKWPDDISVAINLSPVQFRKHDLAAAVTAALKRAGLPPARLELEITETVMLTDDASNIESLNQLRALGVRIAMDDFGTGYSSLSYLRSFPFDKIKIDRSFVSGMHENHHCQAIIRAVAELGRALNIVTTAEGVETIEQLGALRGFGYNEAQGYLFSPPRRDVIIRPLLNIWQKSNPKRAPAPVPAGKAR